MKKLSQMTAAERKARVTKLASNPGTRSKIPDQYLPQPYRQQRELNTRLNAPVVAGSSLTNRDVARSANAGADVKYGDALRQQQQSIGQSEQLARDTAGWFDDYQAKLAQAQGNTVQYGKDTTAAIQSLAGAFGPEDTAGLSSQNATDAGNAAAVRKAILGNLGAVQAAQAGNANTYANQLANVVGPGEKLTAQTQAAGKTQSLRDQLAGLLKEKGSYKQQLVSDAAAAESKNVLALQALGLDQTKAATSAKTAAANIDIRRGVDPVTGKPIKKPASASDRKTAADLAYFKKHGYYPPTGPPKSPKGAKGKSPYLSTGQQATFQNSFASTKAIVAKQKGHYTRQQLSSLLLNGRPASTLYVDKDGNPVDSKAKGAIKVPVPAIPKITNAAALSAALDAVYDGHLSAPTIKKLHAAGIKVNPLGVSTKRPNRATQLANDAISSVGSAVSGLGG